MSNYTLEVISHHPSFRNKSLRKYYVDGIDSVGAWGDEPFEIKFTNHTWQKVQVKISLDGTDILTGSPATTETSQDMWVVNGYGTLSLKAWPETNNGGAQFVFTSANNSVAAHTHGDLSSRGIIAAAVYVEGHVEPIRFNPYPIYQNYRSIYDYKSTGGWSGDYTLGGTYTFNSTDCSGIGSAGANAGSGELSIQNCSFNASDSSAGTADLRLSKSKSLESLVSVGAGQHVDQKITYVQGLIKPTLTETIRVKYLWWDDLVAKLREGNYAQPHASGFPGDSKKTNINLGSTPRVGNPTIQKNAQSYLRI